MSFEYHDYYSRRRLSTSLTFILKYGLTPLVVIPLLIISVIGIIRIEENWGIVIFSLSIAFTFYLLYGGIKSVEADEYYLYISNYLKTIKAPLSAIAEVYEDRFINIRPITIKFRTTTEFGDKIVFIPYWSPAAFFPYQSHPVIEELHRLTKGRIK
jgi:hypothetical protein